MTNSDRRRVRDAGCIRILAPLFRRVCMMSGVFASAFIFVDLAYATDRGTADTIQIQLGGEPSTLDPSRVIDQYGVGILRNVVEGLFKLDPDGKVENGLAESYTVSKDALQYRFRIRADAKWSDGRKVSPADVVAGLRRTLAPTTASPSAGAFFAIKNARAVFQGKMPAASLGIAAGGESGDGNEVVIVLERPDPILPLELTLPPAAPVRQDFLDANKGEWNFRAPVTGDYRISIYKPAEQIELTPNPYARSHGATKVLYRILPEEVTAMNLFETGRLDVITTITPTEIARLQKKNVVRVVPSTTVFYFSFNMATPPFKDLDWRRAVAGVVDRAGLAKILSGVYEPLTSFIPDPLEGALPYRPDDFKSSTSKIKSIAAKPRVRLAYGASGFTKIVAEKVQNDLQRQLGLTITLEPMELKTLLARLRSDPPEMYFIGVSAMFDDPLNQLNVFSNVTDVPFSRYHGAEFERLTELVRVTPKGPKRTELAREANRLLVEKDIAVVPVLLRNQVFGVSPKLKGFHANPYQVIQLNALSR